MAAVCSGVDEYMKNCDNPSLTPIVQDVYNRRTNLLQIVEELGPHLTSLDVDKRCKAVELLSAVLQRLVKFTLSNNEVELLSDFYCDRLRDHYSIVPQALLGLQALASNQILYKDKVVSVMQTIFKEIHIQSLMQSGRYTFYNLLAVFLDKNMHDLQTMGSDLVFGFLQAMDGEKDPRNLVVAFQLARTVIKNFTIDLFAEDLFEVISCYFPIDFTPVPDDPYGIQKEDLVLGLRKCLAATSRFAQFCLPLLMEKLSSDVIHAKIDALLTLSTCLEEYSSLQIKDFLQPFWQAIKREVFQTVSSELEDASLTALSSIVKNLATSPESDAVEIKNDFLALVVRDCCQNLSGPDIRLMKPSGRLLQAAAAASASAHQAIIRETIPLLITKYNERSTQGISKKFTLDVIVELLRVTKNFHKTIDDSPLMPHVDGLSIILFDALSTDSPALRCAATSGLVAMVTLHGLLTEDKVCLFVEHLATFVLTTKDVSVRRESTTALAYLATEFPVIIKTRLLTVLESRLQKEDGSAMEEDTAAVAPPLVIYDYALDTLSAVCTEESVVRLAVPVILEHTRNLVDCFPQDDIETKVNKALKCLLNVVEGTIKHHIVLPSYFAQNVLPDILWIVIKAALQDSSSHPMNAADIQKILSSILRNIISQLQEKAAADALQQITDVFIEGKLPQSLADLGRKFSPLQHTSPWQQTQLVFVLTATVCAARMKVCIPHQTVLLSRLPSLACDCTHRRTTVAAAKCLAGLVNKMSQGDELTALLRTLMIAIWSHLTGDEDKQWRAVITWLWLTRALVIRSHPLAQEFVQKVISLLSDNSMGHVAADGFYIMISDTDDIMNPKMHADIRLMYRQRFFTETLPRLLDRFHSAQSEHKHHHLCALSHLLQWIPKQVLLTEVPSLMPLLIQALTRDEPSLLLSTLQTLYSLVFDAPEIITRQVTSLIPNFLELARYKPSMKVRMEAIKCLGAMTSLPHHVVYVYQTRVIKVLSCTLDDKKRIVRTEAVKCRNEWCLLGSSVR